MVAFELAVQDTYGLAVAARLGVDRIELCSALPLGGVTPSLAFIEAAVATPGIPPVHVLVRPRPGGFDYATDEIALIVRDVQHAIAAGAAGVVVGGIRFGTVDAALVSRVIEVAGDAEVTFHRAFDTLADPHGAIDALVKLGVRRILTSGGAANAAEALPELAGLVAAAGGRIEIMAGGGVRPEVVGDLVRAGVAAVHASGKGTVADTVGVTLGSAAQGGQAGRETTDEVQVGRLLAALRSVHDHRGRDGVAFVG
ncbi:copper homeostasis protein CutC [Paractinoplanes durhamensis]|uniref:PF03932 family protein CutC n=1 Tax=Paractinoplanes durhamensis TaxID=113563 RepID=A0ABQ3YZM9_9ACTN|nr:copper homeostasis protein CutC [Actinoplanes durhamensis]GIE03048.1 copper homeostasis protein CutC [Actinoplanes durhamensis]